MVSEAEAKRLKGEFAGRASQKGLKGQRWRAYVFGTLRKTGWKPKREQRAEGNGGRT